MSAIETADARTGRIAAALIAHGYIRDRAAAEGVPFDLDEQYFVSLSLSGVSNFFGFTFVVDGNGVSFTDSQQPTKGYLRRWLKKAHRFAGSPQPVNLEAMPL